MTVTTTTTAPETMDCYELAATGTLWLDRWYGLLTDERLPAMTAAEAAMLPYDTEFMDVIRDAIKMPGRTEPKATIVYEALQLAATIIAAVASRDAAGFTVSDGRVVTYWRPA